MTKTTDTAAKAKELEARIVSLQAKREAATPRQLGIYTTKLRKAQAELTALVAASKKPPKTPKARAAKASDPQAAMNTKQSVWQVRVEQALSEIADGADVGIVFVCKTPKTATGTATKVRQMIDSGAVNTYKNHVTVKSHGPNIELAIA